MLINPIIRTRTLHLRRAYHPTNDNVVLAKELIADEMLPKVRSQALRRNIRALRTVIVILFLSVDNFNTMRGVAITLTNAFYCSLNMYRNV
jgi:hypothetical protein